MFVRDAHCLAQLARSRAQVVDVREPPAAAHGGKALRRFDGADQDRAGRAGRLADEVQAPVDAIGPVDVDKPGRAEHDAVTLGLAAIAVGGRVGVVIGLELDDHAAHAADHQGRADQLPRHVMDRPVEEAAPEFRG